MKKIYKDKKKKFTTNTYMKEAIEYDIVIIKENKLFITIKKYKKVSNPFIIKNEKKQIKYIDNNYYILELTPLEENYNIRFYFNKKKELIDYYIDITLENGVEYKIPYYIDLYLDIIHYPNNKVKFCDENELKEALDKKIISKKDYEMAYKVGNKLLKEIENNTNKYLNKDIKTYLDKYF
ncbi:MAG: DUF402 domain-containing protein [Bacilli bacterium]|nr:DUF402 domain-containing protein [Bacilli bacterium]